MTKPYKDAEFQAFIKLIEESGQVAHWGDIARALNIEQNTVIAWKQIPQAKAAIAKGITRALKEMETAGKRDWRMWEAKLKMLGINPATKLEHDVSDPIAEILKGYGLNDAGKASETTSQPPPDPA